MDARNLNLPLNTTNSKFYTTVHDNRLVELVRSSRERYLSWSFVSVNVKHTSHTSTGAHGNSLVRRVFYTSPLKKLETIRRIIRSST